MDTHTTRDMAVAGEDATPEAPFRNVPRRRRSAARLPKEEELVGDDPGRDAPQAPPAPTSRDVEGPAVAPSAPCDKKRPADDRGEDETHVRRRDEKRYRPLRAEDAKNGGGGALGRQTFSGVAPPAPSRGTDTAATAASASENCSGERPADWAEKERIRKGKMPAEPSVVVPRGGGKLMADAIRSHGACPKNKPPESKKRKDRGTPFWYGMGRDGQSTSAAGSDVDHSFFKMGAVVSDMLRATLASLGVDDAAAPERVYGRLLSNCDRNRHQSRLQMSCKSWRADRGEYPLCAFLTEKENEEANDKGLTVNAYDRRGKKYKMTIRYLGSNRSYRLINKWGHFLEKNGLVVANGGGSKAKHVMLDLWLFRPPGGGKVEMVMLHYFKGDAAHADAALEEEEDRGAIRRRGDDDDATAAVAKEEASSPVEPDGGVGGSGKDAVTEDVAGGATSGKVEDDGGGVKSEAASGPAFPSDEDEEPDGGGAKAAAGEKQAGPLPSSDADGTKMEEEAGGAPPVETVAQLSPEASASKVEAGGAPGEAYGTKKAEKEANAGTTEAAAGQPSASDAGGSAEKAVDKDASAQGGEDAVQAPSPAVDGAAGGAKKATTFMFGLTQCDVTAAYTLVMLSRGHWA